MEKLNSLLSVILCFYAETTSKKKHICVLATGGTIASRPTPNGLMPALSGEDILAMVPELRERCDIDCVQLLQLDSTNLQPEHWQRMARAVAERRKQSLLSGAI